MLEDKEDYPEFFEMLKRREKKRRFEHLGGFMVNAIPTLKELLYKFYDIISNTSIKNVYDVFIVRYEVILSERKKIIRFAL
jgi:alpha-mannosidase